MSNNLINTIKNRKRLFKLDGANDEQIGEAEKTLALNFSEEYKSYLKEFGCISFNNHEFLGLNTSDRLSVVLTTQFEKMSRKNLFPKDMYVVEVINDGDILILQNNDGEIFELQYNGESKKIYSSLNEYLKSI